MMRGAIEYPAPRAVKLAPMPRTNTALILILVASPAFAQAFYRWVDADGITHYTDNAAAVPRGAAVFATEGEPISEMGKPGPVPAAVPKPPATVEQKHVDVDPSVPSLSEEYWRAQFRGAHEKIHQIEDEIAADRHRTEDINGLPISLSYTCLPQYGYAPSVK